MKKKLKILTILSFILLFLTIFSSSVFAIDGSGTFQTTPSDTHPWYIQVKLNSSDDYMHMSYKTESECKTAYNTEKNKSYFEIKECKNFNSEQQTAGSDNSSAGETKDISGQDAPSSDTTIYNLLAPLPGLEKSIGPTTMSDYFNTIIKVIIGLCAVLAVVMIVIGGVEYMGKDSIFGKSKGKERMIGAITGLILALGAYALLNTINPDLLGVKGLNIKTVSATIDFDTETDPWEGSSFGNNKKLCPNGFKNVNVPWGIGNKETLNICSDIMPDIVRLLNDAHKKNIILSGSGSRTTEEQQALRVENGCPDPKTESRRCTPPTARPGHSMHESGKAIDFRCNNVKMTSGDVCFTWLSENAKKYGLKNLRSEPWHWSVNGK